MIAVKSPTPIASSPRERAFPSHPISPKAYSPIKTPTRTPLMPTNNTSPLEPSVLTDAGTVDESKAKTDTTPPPYTANGPEANEQNDLSQKSPITSPSIKSPSLSLQTSGTHLSRSKTSCDGNDDYEPQSVIHAPEGFGQFRTIDSPEESTSSSPKKSDVTITLHSATENNDVSGNKKPSNSPVSPPALTTSIAPSKEWSERTTPRAQTWQEIEDFKGKPHHRDLEDIEESSDIEVSQDEPEEEPEQIEPEQIDVVITNLQENEGEIDALRTALSECWTLCNTLASLSYIHRERLFNFGGGDDMQEQAWKTCWKLCQKLYETRDDDHSSQVPPTLDLCREFCQALFEVRVKDNEVADSVLRVSFELNNHLYNTHDRNLPEAFRERTLDFYITLCHRLMKQRTRLTEESDSLLRACWSLAEMLFSLRQSRREGKLADEELLGSAVQSCWELCDLFREGWSQIRPDRGTPRPSQPTFAQAFYQTKRAEDPPDDSISTALHNPETPTTIFDDTATVSPDQAPVPNLVVLGFENGQNMHPRWSSNSSTLSGYSHNSGQTTSSTHTIKSPNENPNLTCLKLLVVRAAMNSGFQRGGTQPLPTFVKTLSSDSFGTSPWQTSLLANYKKLVTVDPGFRALAPPARADAVDVARAVQAMVQHNGQYKWLQDLYRLVFGFHTEEAIMNTSSVAIQT